MIANTWGTVYRGEGSNEYGDPTDLTEAVGGLERIPMSIIEQTRTVSDPESDEARTIRYGTGRAKAGLDIQADDRIQDERTKLWWLVRSVSRAGSTFYGARDLSLDLRAV